MWSSGEHLSCSCKHGIRWPIIGINSCETVQHAGPKESVQIKKRSPGNEPYGTLVLCGQGYKKEPAKETERE